MLSNKLRLILTLLNFSPVFIVLWIANLLPKLINNIRTSKSILSEIHLSDFYQLGYFVVCIIVCGAIFRLTIKTLPPYSIKLKTIKSADTNFSTLFMSYLLPLAKLQFKKVDDHVILLLTLILFLLLAYISKKSFHFNPILRLVFQLKHYEVQTEEGLYLIVLSKELLVNKNQVENGIRLTDYVILNYTIK